MRLTPENLDMSKDSFTCTVVAKNKRCSVSHSHAHPFERHGNRIIWTASYKISGKLLVVGRSARLLVCLSSRSFLPSLSHSHVLTLRRRGREGKIRVKNERGSKISQI